MAQTNLAIKPVQLATFTTTSGTLVDFTNIPAGTRKITLTINRVSTNAASNLLVQLGTAAGLVTSGYNSQMSNSGSAGTGSANITTGFSVWNQNALDITVGVMTLTHIGGNVWVYGWSGGLTNGTQHYGNTGGGAVTLGDVLTRLRFTTESGTAVFDSGSVSVMYE